MFPNLIPREDDLERSQVNVRERNVVRGDCELMLRKVDPQLVEFLLKGHEILINLSHRLNWGANLRGFYRGFRIPVSVLLQISQERPDGISEVHAELR